jgi:HD-GYP domain-containing protein (c-di-GMP phosphodiesterase class II)
VIAVHYPSEWIKEAFIRELCGTTGLVFAPYENPEAINAVPSIVNIAILKSENDKVPKGIVPLIQSAGGKQGFLAVSEFGSEKIKEVLRRKYGDDFSAGASLQQAEAQDDIVKALEQVSIALTMERDHGRLLSLILEKARFLSKADAGSLYLIEKDKDGGSEPKLRFVLAQNDSVNIAFEEKVMPLSDKSIAGFVAVSGETLRIEDAYKLPEGTPYSHNRKYDEEIGYRAKSMLVLPMKNSRGETIGVLQLINRKKDWKQKLSSVLNIEESSLPFDNRILELMRSFSSMAAVAMENNALIKSIQDLFEGFVQASVTAVEQRDPTTSGHSQRVSILTLSLAETADKSTSGPFKDMRFSEKDMREIRYASILHDFGKIGVREDVLVKAKKLYPSQYEAIMLKTEIARMSKERDYLLEEIALFEKGEATPEKIESLKKGLGRHSAEMDEIESIVKRTNEPTVLPEGDFRFLQDLAKVTFRNTKGEVMPLISLEEIKILSIPKGTLTEEERIEIESHVTHSFEFLRKIPWTEEFRNIPDIAYAHHEKLNGQGYPRKLSSPLIPAPSRMMAVADIFDALSASDRPYKKAVPIEKTLDILQMEAKSGQLDMDIVRLFIDAKLYEKTMHLRRVY